MKATPTAVQTPFVKLMVVGLASRRKTKICFDFSPGCHLQSASTPTPGSSLSFLFIRVCGGEKRSLGSKGLTSVRQLQSSHRAKGHNEGCTCVGVESKNFKV